MDIIIRNSGGVPIYDQITRQMKGLILRGELKEGEALPSMRLLAKELRISVITTKRAYEELEREGFLTTVPGKGCFVAPQNPELVREDTLRRAEEHLSHAVDVAKAGGVTLAELTETLNLLYGNEDGRQRDEDGRHERAAGLPETGLFIRSIFLHHPQAGSGYSTLRKLRFSGLSRKTRFGLTKTHVPETNRANVLSARHKMFRPAYKKTTRKGSVSGLK